MDTRITLNDKESFFQLLRELHGHSAKVSLLYDDNGLTRYEGLINHITGGSEPVLQLEGGLEIPLPDLIAVNGIFVPEYSEC